MATIRLWKGFHGESHGEHDDERLRDLIERSWEREELLILCPPLLGDFDFIGLLPEGDVQVVGSWAPACRDAAMAASREPRREVSFPKKPVLGVFTTGTVSGKPRLVLYTQANIESSLAGILGVFEVDRIREVFCYPQPFHTFGLTLGYVHAVLRRLPLSSGPGRYSRAFHERWVSTVGEGTLTLGAPTHFRDLAEYVAKQGAKPKRSYSSIVGGAKVSVPLWMSMRETLGIQMPSIGYGATEASPGIAHLPPGRVPAEDGEIGFPLSHLTSVEVVPKSGIRFTGPNLCLAVVQGGQIEFPREMLIRDEVERRADGVWVYRGRTDLVLNRGGVKFSLERIEELLQAQLGLEAVCVPVPDQRLGEELGVLWRGTGKQPDRETLNQWLYERLGQRFEPRYFLQVEEFPLNGSLKLDRHSAGALLRKSVGFDP